MVRDGVPRVAGRTRYVKTVPPSRPSFPHTTFPTGRLPQYRPHCPRVVPTSRPWVRSWRPVPRSQVADILTHQGGVGNDESRRRVYEHDTHGGHSTGPCGQGCHAECATEPPSVGHAHGPGGSVWETQGRTGAGSRRSTEPSCKRLGRHRDKAVEVFTPTVSTIFYHCMKDPPRLLIH